jgi:hypothetical protein
MAAPFPQRRGLTLFLLALPYLASSYQEEGRAKRIGLKRVLGKALRSRLSSRQAPADLVVPLPNDTISEAYWEQVNAAINTVAMQTQPPPSINDPGPTADDEPWKKVFKASVQNQVNMDAAPVDYSYVTPRPIDYAASTHASAGHVKSLSVIPYDMALGAHIMYGLSEKNTRTPPPTQAYVSQEFVAQCPMLMMQDTVLITPPKCNVAQGAWVDPTSGRNLLHWKDQGGSLVLGVDSAVGGEGSATFATIVEQITMARSIFHMKNCLDIPRYLIEEHVIKVTSMAAGAVSTMYEHDASQSEQAIFYEYTISHPNGTVAAKTNLHRKDSNQVNFTLVDNEGLPGEVISSANRIGHWERAEWKTCDGDLRGWQVEFPAESSLFETVATVQDLRVATTAAILLMAVRDEEAANDGFRHHGQGQLYWTLFKTILCILAGLAVVGFVLMAFKKRGYEHKLKKLCFRLEASMLPRYPAAERLPVIGATY